VVGRTSLNRGEVINFTFFVASDQFPANRTDGLRMGNHNEYTWFLRSLLLKLSVQTRDGTQPPESRYPQVANGSPVELDALEFPRISWVRPPVEVSCAY